MATYLFACQTNRSVKDAVNLALHYTLQHLQSHNTYYTRILFIDIGQLIQ